MGDSCGTKRHARMHGNTHSHYPFHVGQKFLLKALYHSHEKILDGSTHILFSRKNSQYKRKHAERQGLQNRRMAAQHLNSYSFLVCRSLNVPLHCQTQAKQHLGWTNCKLCQSDLSGSPIEDFQKACDLKRNHPSYRRNKRLNYKISLPVSTYVITLVIWSFHDPPPSFIPIHKVHN